MLKSDGEAFKSSGKALKGDRDMLKCDKEALTLEPRVQIIVCFFIIFALRYKVPPFIMLRIKRDINQQDLKIVNFHFVKSEHNWMASCTSGITHIKKTMKKCVIDSNNLINIRVSHLGLDHLVTDFVTFLC